MPSSLMWVVQPTHRQEVRARASLYSRLSQAHGNQPRILAALSLLCKLQSCLFARKQNQTRLDCYLMYIYMR